MVLFLALGYIIQFSIAPGKIYQGPAGAVLFLW